MCQMASRTYIPALVGLLHAVCKYIARYRTTIETFLPEGGADALSAIVAACEVFMALVPDNTGA